MAELSRVYPDGMFYVAGNYSAFLEQKAEFLHAQAKHQKRLENRVRTEMEWLRRGPKARATKAKARIDNAGEMIAELADLKSRSRTADADIDFVATGQQDQAPDPSGRGRLRLRRQDSCSTISTSPSPPACASAWWARTAAARPRCSSSCAARSRRCRGRSSAPTNLRIVYFDQRRQINPDLTLRRALAPDSDSVIYRDRVIHVASWAARFLFASDQLDQPVSKLSGGERARVLIANLMLEPADVLLLDEPTNDLDIPTLEILEESLLEFHGALVLVTHDRYLLDRVSTIVLGLDGSGKAQAIRRLLPVGR